MAIYLNRSEIPVWSPTTDAENRCEHYERLVSLLGSETIPDELHEAARRFRRTNIVETDHVENDVRSLAENRIHELLNSDQGDGSLNGHDINELAATIARECATHDVTVDTVTFRPDVSHTVSQPTRRDSRS